MTLTYDELTAKLITGELQVSEGTVASRYVNGYRRLNIGDKGLEILDATGGYSLGNSSFRESFIKVEDGKLIIVNKTCLYTFPCLPKEAKSMNVTIIKSQEPIQPTKYPYLARGKYAAHATNLYYVVSEGRGLQIGYHNRIVFVCESDLTRLFGEMTINIES